jgi:hypothetical protein
MATRSGITLEQKQAWLREKNSSCPGLAGELIFSERHYSVSEVAELWNLSQDKVRSIFENELGVLILPGGGSPHTRRYRTLRIPESVLQRVHRRLSCV